MRALREVVEECWSMDTSAKPDQWSRENASLGQCAVTALVIQDWVGGELLRGVVNGESHYWNRLPSGQVADWTLQQFVHPRLEDGVVVRDRDYVLSFPDTLRRYRVLSEAVSEAISGRQSAPPNPETE